MSIDRILERMRYAGIGLAKIGPGIRGQVFDADFLIQDANLVPSGVDATRSGR